MSLTPVEPFFPFKIDARGAQYPSKFLTTFRANKPEHLAWDSFDVVVRSPSDVTFKVFDSDEFEDMVGDQIAALDVVVDRALLAPEISARAADRARARRAAELLATEEAIIARYTVQELVEIDFAVDAPKDSS